MKTIFPLLLGEHLILTYRIMFIVFTEMFFGHTIPTTIGQYHIYQDKHLLG